MKKGSRATAGLWHTVRQSGQHTMLAFAVGFVIGCMVAPILLFGVAWLLAWAFAEAQAS